MDDATPLMIALQLGHIEVAEYLIDGFGCTVDLSGPRAPNDERAPRIDGWMEFLPEITHFSHMPLQRFLNLPFDARMVCAVEHNGAALG